MLLISNHFLGLELNIYNSTGICYLVEFHFNGGFICRDLVFVITYSFHCHK